MLFGDLQGEGFGAGVFGVGMQEEGVSLLESEGGGVDAECDGLGVVFGCAVEEVEE